MSNRVLWILVLALLNGYDETAGRVQPVSKSRYLPQGAVQSSTWSKNYSRELRAGGTDAIIDFPGRNHRPEPDWTMVLKLPPDAVDVWQFRRLYSRSTREWQHLAVAGDADLPDAIAATLATFGEIQDLADASRAVVEGALDPYAFFETRNADVGEAIESDWRETVSSPLAVTYRRWVQLHLLAYDDPARTIQEVLERVHPETGRALGAMPELDLWGFVSQAAAYSAHSVEEREARDADIKRAASRFPGVAEGYDTFEDWWRDRGAGPPHSWGVPGFDQQGVVASRIGVLARPTQPTPAIPAPPQPRPPAPSMRRSRLSVVIASLVGLVAVGVVLVVVLLSRDSGTTTTLVAPTTTADQTTANSFAFEVEQDEPEVALDVEELEVAPDVEIVKTILVGESPHAITADDAWVWVPLEGAAAIVRIDPVTLVPETFSVGMNPTRPLIHGETVWVPSRDEGVVTVLDRTTGATLATVPVGQNPDTPVVAADLVWVAVRDDSALVAIDPDTFTEVDRLEPVAFPLTPVFVQGGLWVAGRQSGTITRVDPFARSLTGDELEVGPRPFPPIVVEDGEIWISDRGGTVTIVNAIDRRWEATLPVGGFLSQPVAAGADVWVSDRGSVSVVAIDTGTRKITRRIPTGFETSDPTLHGGFVWTSAIEESVLLRIDPNTRIVERVGVDGTPGIPLSAHGFVWVPDSSGTTVTLLRV